MEKISNGAVLRILQQFPANNYREFDQPKTKFGGPQRNNDGTLRMRHIVAPTALLKTVQKEINNNLRQFELPDCMHGGVVEKNNFTNAIQHIENKYFLTIDLKNFFGSISNTRIHRKLIGLEFSWTDARIITKTTTFNGSLPQGAPTSTTLANLSFSYTALALENFCRERNIKFTAFVDDLTFSSKTCFKQYTNDILQILKNNGFRANHKKIHYTKNCCEITGINLRRGKLVLPDSILLNIDKPGVRKYVEAFVKQCENYKTDIAT